MSLTFQSGESIKQALFEELQNILNPNTEVRVAAEGRMKQLEYTEGCGSQFPTVDSCFDWIFHFQVMVFFYPK